MTDSKGKSRKRKALGRGLKNLIPDRGEDVAGRLFQIPVDDIEPRGDQPRSEFDEEALQELADSIRESGLIQPLVVREVEETYELIAGERRLRASRKAGLEEVSVVIRDVSDAEAYALALVENIQREDLNPVEEATAYERLKDELELTQSELADHLGKSRSAIANATRLLNLPESVQQKLVDQEISAGHARALVSLPHDVAMKLAEEIVEEGLSVRETEELAKEAQDDKNRGKRTTPSGSRYRDDAQVRQITEDLQRSLGTKVKVKDRHGKGKLEIHYDDYDILQSVLDRILE